MNAMGENLRGNQGILGFGSKLVVRWPLLRDVLNFCFFEAIFFIAYRFAMSFSHVCASPFWFPDSILLCALLLNRPRRWWIYLLAPLPIRLFVAVPPHVPVWFLLTMFAIDSIKGLVTAALLRRFIRNPFRFETVREFAIY
jgi:integral membrane sensor domain MASE1